MTPTRQRKIVVGVDGSASSRCALSWAASEAVLRSVDLEVVYAFSLTAIALASPGTAVMLKDTDLRQVGVDLLNDALDELGDLPPRTTARVVEDIAADALLDCSSAAEMLVLGAHGKNTFGGARFRPTHQQCLRHARCPVVIIPEEER
jgi:nucleotide-binding universal stress UspA family protein